MFRHEDLVDDNVVCINAVLGQLLYETFSLKEGEELGNAHANKSGFLLHKQTRFSVLEATETRQQKV